MQPSEKEIREFVIQSFLFGLDDGSLSNDSSFLDNGIIDSTGVLELITFVERQYGVKVEDEELVPENLDSVNRLATFIEKKKQALCAGGVSAA